MSGRSSNRKRNSGGGNKNNNKKKQQSNNKKKSQKVDPKKLWGDFDALPKPDGFATSTPDPVAVVNSLGQPPLPGHGPASPHYFKLVYGRATQLAGALAMAGEIDDLSPEPLPEPEPEEEIADEGNQLDDAAGDEDDELAEASADDSPNEDGNALTEASADEEPVVADNKNADESE